MNETNEKKKVSTKTNVKRITSVLLIFALVITGIFAFLTATDSKVNTFKIGNVDIDLIEKFDINKDGTITDTNGDGIINRDDEYEPITNEDGEYFVSEQPPEVTNIIPGQKIIKEPWVENTGTLPSWVYLVVAMPTAQESEIRADAEEHVALHSNGPTQIDIKAFAFQDNYKKSQWDDGAETYENIWNAYNYDYDGADHEAAADTSDRYEFMQAYVDGATEAGMNLTDWVQIGSVYQSDDGYNYYTYAYPTLLNARPVGSTDDVAYPATPSLFDYVKLINEVGEPASTDFSVWYYKDITFNNGGGSGVAGANDDLARPAPEIAGKENFKTETYSPGTTLTVLSGNEASEVFKDGYSMNWVDADTGKIAYTGMPITKNTKLIPKYTNIAGASLNNDYSYLAFSISEPSSDIPYTHANFLGILSSTVVPEDLSSLVIPNKITVTLHTENYTTYITCDYTLEENGHEKTTLTDWAIANYFNGAKEGTFELPVAKIKSVNNLQSKITTVSIPDSVIRIQDNAFKNCTLLTSVNIPYSCKYLNSSAILNDVVNGGGVFRGCTSLTNVTIPSSILSLPQNTFRNTGLTKVVIPESMLAVGDYCFYDTPVETIIWKSACSMPSLAFTRYDTIKFVYSNSVDFRLSSNLNSYEVTNCKVILTKNTQNTRLSAFFINSNSTLNYFGTETEFRALGTFDTTTIPPLTVGYRLDSYGSGTVPNVYNYVLTPEDLIIING